MFNVFALLLDDALLKCVVSEVVLFSIVAFKTLTFHKVVYGDTLEAWWAGSLVTVLVQCSPDSGSEISLKIVRQCASFLGHPVYLYAVSVIFAKPVLNISMAALKVKTFTFLWWMALLNSIEHRDSNPGEMRLYGLCITHHCFNSDTIIDYKT